MGRPVTITQIREKKNIFGDLFQDLIKKLAK